jgi:hypothetical protein
MKKTFFFAGIISLLLTLAVNAQDSTSSKPVQSQTTKDTITPAQTQPSTQTQTMQPSNNMAQTKPTAQEQKKYGNPTVDSILSKYSLVPMPNQLTTEQIFPVVGQYQSNSNPDQKLTVTLDDQSKGVAWIDGLPQGKVKAILKNSPATYKIPAQKTAEGTDVPEGTLVYDKDTKVINVMLGRPFNDQDPASVFNTANTTTDQSMTTANDQNNDQSKMNDQSKTNMAKAKTSKSKAKVKKEEAPPPPPYVFTGTKVEQVTATNQ